MSEPGGKEWPRDVMTIAGPGGEVVRVSFRWSGRHVVAEVEAPDDHRIEVARGGLTPVVRYEGRAARSAIEGARRKREAEARRAVLAARPTAGDLGGPVATPVMPGSIRPLGPPIRRRQP